LPEKRFLHDIANPCSAVIVEKIVLVVFIFRPCVFGQQLEEALALQGIELEDLLAHGPTLAQIKIFEGARGFHIEEIAQAAAQKFHVKIRLVEFKRAIVVAPVEAVKRIENPDGAVAEGTVQFLPWRDRHQADLRVIGEYWRLRVRRMHRYKRQEEQDSPFHSEHLERDGRLEGLYICAKVVIFL
jgi:hypothetical protein